MGSAKNGDLAVGACVLLFAGLVAYLASLIPVSLYARVGPQVVPYAVAGGLALLGALLVAKALRGGWSGDDPELTMPVDWKSARWLGLGLALNLALIADLGFTLASTALFACTARCFGSTNPLRDVGIGFLLAITAYLGFSKGLGINIGAGPLEALF